MRQFVTYSGRHKVVLLVLLCLGIGTCDKQIVAPTQLIPPTINTSSLPDAILSSHFDWASRRKSSDLVRKVSRGRDPDARSSCC